jgi:hypothetical protein
MEVEAGCAIDNYLDPNKQQVESLSYASKRTNETMIFSFVRLRQRDGAEAHKWIKHTLGTGKAHPTPKWEEMEWTHYLTGIPMSDGWRRFDVSLRKSVEETWGYYGWSLNGLLAIRLRGKLSISPLEFFESSD